MSPVVKLVLPYPVSANRYWRSFRRPGASRADVVLSTQAKAFKHQVALIASGAGLKAPMPGRLVLTAYLYPARPKDWQARQRRDGQAWDDDVRCIDLGNCEKVMSDALQGILFENDKQLRSIHLLRMVPDEHGARLVVSVCPMPEES